MKIGSGSGFVRCVVGTEIGGGFPVRAGWRGETPTDRLTIMMSPSFQLETGQEESDSS